MVGGTARGDGALPPAALGRLRHRRSFRGTARRRRTTSARCGARARWLGRDLEGEPGRARSDGVARGRPQLRGHGPRRPRPHAGRRDAGPRAPPPGARPPPPTTDGLAPPAAPGCGATGRGDLARMRGDATRAIELSRQALARLPKDSTYLRSKATWNLGISSWMGGDLAAAEEAFVELAAGGGGAGPAH